MPAEQPVDVTDDGGIAIITLNRPAVLNAVDESLRDAFIAAMQAANAAAATRAVVITGAGARAFCAGQDLAVSQRLDGDSVAAWFQGLRAFSQAVRDMEKPVIAALNGVAVGAGLQVALWCDMRVAHAGVTLVQPEIEGGIPSSIGAMALREIAGQSRAVEICLSGRAVPAEEGRRIGLVSEIVAREAVLPRALEIARTLAAQPPNALRLTKNRLRDMTQAAFDDAYAATIAAARKLYAAGEPQAAVAAFRARAGR